jgi:hypothetical protein
MTKLSDYKARAVGIAWARKEDYPALLSIFEDADDLPPTWERFIERAEKMEQSYKDQGYIVERVYMDPETFSDWCHTHGVGINSQGRMRFAAVAVAEKYGKNQS